MRVSSHDIPAAVPSRKNPSMHRIGGWVGSRNGLVVREKRNSLAPAVIQTLDYPAYGLVNILAVLSQFTHLYTYYSYSPAKQAY
jgi:hypothetical protein